MQKVTSFDIQCMRRALQMALRGTGRVHPNPRVGAVLAGRGKVISEGAHELFGGAHAERNALKSVQRAPAGATLYVTLEPCGHFGKTPPCVDLILLKKIRRVVIGSRDPNPLVAGRGLRRLKKAGVRVVTGVLQKEAERLNLDYRYWVCHGMPYVTLKVAQSVDGKIATWRGDSKWITGPPAREFSQGLRARADAVLVGVNTVLADNPRLTVRRPGIPRQPMKVILDATLKMPPGARLFSGTTAEGVTLFTSRRAAASRRRALQKNATIVVVPEKTPGRVDLKAVLRYLAKKGITHVLIEGGGEVTAAALSARLVQEAFIFIAPRIIGGRDAVASVGGTGARKLSQAWTFRRAEWKQLGQDLLLHGEF